MDLSRREGRPVALLEYFDTGNFYKYNVHMKQLTFEWDDSKARANLEMHGISFEEARTAF